MTTPSHMPKDLPPDPTETYGADTWRRLDASRDAPAPPDSPQPRQGDPGDTTPLQWTNTDWKVLNIAAQSAEAANSPIAEHADSITVEHKYALHQRVAQGGFAEIWEATQQPLRRLIAVKRLRDDLFAKEATDSQKAKLAAQHFMQEVLTTANLQHPNIIPVHDLGVDKQGRPLMVMKLVKGRPWSVCIQDDWEMPAWEYYARHLAILIDVANAVAFAHKQGVVHRDLKPSQVMIGEFGEVVVMDWGLAVLLEQPGSQDQGTPPSQVARIADLPFTTTSPAGTPSYMAPEQTQADMSRIGPWTDIYLLGGMLYYVLTGTPPHYEETSEEAFAQAAGGKITPPAERCPGRVIPSELAALAMKALAPNPADRIPSALEMVKAMQDYLTGAGKHREAQEILDSVESQIDEEPIIYRTLAEALASLARAEGLWKDNPRVPPLRERVREIYTRLALERGDLSLARLQAERLSDDTLRHALGRDIDKAQHKLEKTARERRIYLWAAAIFVVLLIAGSWRYIQDQQAALWRAEDAERTALEQKQLAEKAAMEADHQRLQAEISRAEALQAQTRAEREQYLAAINSAYLYLKEGSTNLVKDIIYNHTPAWARNWEWGYLHHLMHQEERLLHTASINFEVYDARFSPDGRRIAAADRSGAVMLWDAQSGQLLQTRLVHSRGIWTVAFSPDGTRILTASFDYTAAILDANTLNIEAMLRGHTGYLRGADWSPDGLMVATAATDGTVRVWAVDSGQLIQSLNYPTTFPYDVAFHPDGRTIAIACLNKYAALVEWESGRILRELEGHDGNVRTIAFSSDGAYVATGASNDQVHVYETDSAQLAAALPVGDCTPHCVAFSPDGRLLALADNTGNARLWDWREGELLATLFGSLKGWAVAFSPDGERLITTCDREIRAWRLEDIFLYARRVADEDVPASADPESLRANSLPMDRDVVWLRRDTPWIEDDGKAYFEKSGRYYRVDSFYRIDNPAGGSQIEIGYLKSEAIVHFPGTERDPITLRNSQTYAAAFSPDGTLAATTALSGLVEIWNTDTWEPVAKVPLKDVAACALAFSPNGSLLAVSQADGTITIYDCVAGAIARSIPAHQKLAVALRFNRDGSRLLSASSDKTAALWNVQTGEMVHDFIGHREVVLSVAFSPDESRIVTASYDGTARLWDAESGAPLLIVHKTERGEVLAGAEFSRDGREIIAITTDGRLAVHRAADWNTPPNSVATAP